MKLTITDKQFMAAGSMESYRLLVEKWLVKRGFDLDKPIARAYSHEAGGMVYTQDE